MRHTITLFTVQSGQSGNIGKEEEVKENELNMLCLLFNQVQVPENASCLAFGFLFVFHSLSVKVTTTVREYRQRFSSSGEGSGEKTKTEFNQDP